MPDVEPPWTDTVSLAVHELRTPVNVVSGYVKMLLGGYGGPITDMQRHALEAAEQSGARVVELLADLSEFSRLASGRLALDVGRVEVECLLQDAAARFVAPLGNGVRCVTAPPTPTAAVAADRQRTARALATLAAAVARRRPALPAVTVTAVLRPGEVALVATEGAGGVNREDLDELDPLPEGEGGLGVGLPFARLLARAVGGRAGTVSKAGSYSLALVLPLA